jgi:hypothetical protein
LRPLRNLTAADQTPFGLSCIVVLRHACWQRI